MFCGLAGLVQLGPLGLGVQELLIVLVPCPSLKVTSLLKQQALVRIKTEALLKLGYQKVKMCELAMSREWLPLQSYLENLLDSMFSTNTPLRQRTECCLLSLNKE